jgi:putative membrane protein
VSEQRPEPQFQLANERTYLAWLRTALALVASGVAAARLLAGQTFHWAWETVGVLLIMAGVVTAALAGADGGRWTRLSAMAGHYQLRGSP